MRRRRSASSRSVRSSSPAAVSLPSPRPSLCRRITSHDTPERFEPLQTLAMEHQDFCLHIAAASPLEKYPAKQHARRVAEFLGVRKGLIYLPGAPTAYLEDSDQFVPFRQRRYFYYLSGVDEPDCHLTYDIRLDELMLYVPAAGSPRKVYYNGRGSTPAEALEKYDVDAVHWSSAVADYVEFWMTQHEGDIYILHPDQAVVPGHDRLPRVNYTKLQAAIDAARVRKDQHEIKLIRKANEISAKAHANVLKNIVKFKNEAQVEASFLDTCIAADAKHQAYEIIAASGENAATLHYIKNDEPFEDRQLICLDAGCEWQCYASDVTRTFPLTGQWPSKESKEIYDLVLKIQTKCNEAIKPGARYLDIHYLAHRILIDGLLDLGIFHNGTAEEIFDAGTSLAFLPHGLGHHLGLEVHDVSDVPLMASTPQDISPVVDLEMCKAPVHPDSAALEEGMVVTVEPGIYFNRYALDAVYFPDPSHAKYINREVLLRYLPVGGVRIEDDILVTDYGYENLTTAPKGEEMFRLIQEPYHIKNRNGQSRSRKNKAPPSKRESRESRETSPKMLSRNKEIEAWSQHVSSRPSEPLSEMPALSQSSHAVELEGGQQTPERPYRSSQFSAAPASFEATGWPVHENSAAAELPSEPANSPQPSDQLKRQISHWHKVPPALARMASTQSLSNRSLPEYTPSQMFQRPRQAPIPPQKLPELPAKPLAYRQSMPIIISGSNAAKSSTKSQGPPIDARSKPVILRFKPFLHNQNRNDDKGNAMEDLDKRHLRLSESNLPGAATRPHDDYAEQQQDQRVMHRASIAIGEQYAEQLRRPGPAQAQQQYSLFWQQVRQAQERQREAVQRTQAIQVESLHRSLALQQEALRKQKEQHQQSLQMQRHSLQQHMGALAGEQRQHMHHYAHFPSMNEQEMKDYMMQLTILEEQNDKRLKMAREERFGEQQQKSSPVSREEGGDLTMASRTSSPPSSYYSAGFEMKY